MKNHLEITLRKMKIANDEYSIYTDKKDLFQPKVQSQQDSPRLCHILPQMITLNDGAKRWFSRFCGMEYPQNRLKSCGDAPSMPFQRYNLSWQVY